VEELDIIIVFATPTLICSLGEKDASNAMGNTCLHPAIRIYPVIQILVIQDQGMVNPSPVPTNN
jgi:hypothetical protein